MIAVNVNVGSDGRVVIDGNHIKASEEVGPNEDIPTDVGSKSPEIDIHEEGPAEVLCRRQ